MNLKKYKRGIMEYINTGVSEQALGIPTEEERKELEKNYTLMSKDPDSGCELWLKNIIQKTAVCFGPGAEECYSCDDYCPYR